MQCDWLVAIAAESIFDIVFDRLLDRLGQFSNCRFDQVLQWLFFDDKIDEVAEQDVFDNVWVLIA